MPMAVEEVAVLVILEDRVSMVVPMAKPGLVEAVEATMVADPNLVEKVVIMAKVDKPDKAVVAVKDGVSMVSRIDMVKQAQATEISVAVQQVKQLCH